MRHFHRPQLSRSVEAYLRRKTKEVEVLAPAEQKVQIGPLWKGARGTKSMKAVFSTLCRMVGKRERCMYCEDSRGTSIDHFLPKSLFPCKAFEWLNMLLACDGCQKAKGACFPLDSQGTPLLIDPTSEHPWDFLIFVAQTGMVTPRFDPATGAEVPKGKATKDLLPLNDEAVTEGRARTCRNLCRAVEAFLLSLSSSLPSAKAEDELLRSVRDNSEYGLGEWYFLREGQTEKPFAELRRTSLASFRKVQATFPK